MRALIVLGLCLSLACGEAGDPDAPSLDTTGPLAWSAGQRIALVTVNRLTRDPLLGDPVCSIDVQLGEARVDGTIDASDSEGACFVSSTSLGLAEGDFTPIDGGTLDLRVGGSVDRVTVDGSTLGSPLAFECARLESERSVGVTSLAGESATDALGDLMTEVTLQAAPAFSDPEELRPGVASWPAGELAIAWNGGLGDSVEIVLTTRDGSGPAVRCFTADDGSFTIPARLTDAYRGVPATLEVARVGVEVQTVDGVDMYLASRSATQLWLELR